MRENPLRTWRKEKHLKAVEVALKLGISEQSVLSYEKGRYEPSRENMAKLAELMNLDLTRLNLSWKLWKRDRKSVV